MQRARLRELLAFVRTNSPYYSRLYQGLPDDIDDVAALPVTHKLELMANFDDWCTDRDVTLAEAAEFVADEALIGTPFLGKYHLSTTSGTTGNQVALFVMSDAEARLVDGGRTRPGYVRDALRAIASELRSRLRHGRRPHVTIAITRGHYALSTMLRRAADRVSEQNLPVVLPGHLTVPELVEELNGIRPGGLTAYGGLMTLLAREKRAGRLLIEPRVVIVTGQGVSDAEREAISSAFGRRVHDLYACSEALQLSYFCREGWHHVFADSVIFEPVDADGAPTPRGNVSHSVLLTVLWRRLQPILRYDLGDAVMERPDACPCGSHFPAYKVLGRSAEMLDDDAGNPVALGMLVTDELCRRVSGLTQVQFAFVEPDVVEARFVAEPDQRDEVWSELSAVFPVVLAEHGVREIGIVRAEGPPVQTAGGKIRLWIPLG